MRPPALARASGARAPTRAGGPRLVAGLLALALGALSALGPGSGAWAATPAEYREVVAGAVALAERAAAADEADRQAALAEIGRRLDAVGAVEIAPGQTVAVANPPLRAALADGDASLARAHLSALLAALDAALAAPAPPPDARARLAAVLARPEFRPPEPGWLDRLIEPVVAPVRLAWQRFWRALLTRLDAPLGGEGRLALVALGVLVMLGVGALLAGAFAGNVVGSAQAARARPTARPSATAARARALALAGERQYRAAIHELYLATLLRLDERGLLRYRPNLTNREHLARGGISSALAPLLTPLVEAYDRLWYGGVACTADDWQTVLALANAAWHAPAGAPVPVPDPGDDAPPGSAAVRRGAA